MQYQKKKKRSRTGQFTCLKTLNHGFTHSINHEKNTKKAPLLKEQRDINNVCNVEGLHALSLPGMVWTSSSIIRPHSWLLSHSITLSASQDLFVVCPNMEYVLMATEQPMGLSLASDVKRQIWLSSMVDHILNWAFHCSTDTAEFPSTRHRLRTVHAAVTPTRDLPAPAGQEEWHSLAISQTPLE